MPLEHFQRLQELNQKGHIWKKNPGITRLGNGVLMTEVTKETLLGIQDNDRSGHLGCFGTTRVGKTRLIENIVSQDIMKGYNVAVIDPKGDVKLFSRIVQVAAEAGRLNEILFLTPIYPDLSIMLDPLSHYYMEDELIGHVVSGIEAKEDYYVKIAWEVTQAVLEGLIVQARHASKKFNVNFHDLKNRSDYESLKTLKEEVQQIPDTQDLVANFQQILNSEVEFFAKVSSSLRTTLAALSSGNTGKIIGKARHNEFIKRFEEGKGVIFFCSTGSLLTQRTAHTIGKVVVSMLRSLLGRVYASGRKFNPPLCIHIDEGHNILYRGIQELFNKGGGANVWVHIYTQSIAQMVEEVGESVTQSIVDNINTWVYMRVNHPETARHVEDTSPLVPDQKSLYSLGGGVTISQSKQKMILAHRVLELAEREFYMRSGGRLYKGVTETVPPLYVNLNFPVIRVVDENDRPASNEAPTTAKNSRSFLDFL